MTDKKDTAKFVTPILESHSEKFANEHDQEVIDQIIFKINNDESLKQNEARLLENILSEQLKDDMIKALSKEGVSLIMEADTQTNYVDAWGFWCRDVR